MGPASRGTHRRLQSISNDEWDDNGDDQDPTSIEDLLERRQSLTITSPFRSSESDPMSDSETYTDEDRFTTDDDVRDHYDHKITNEFSSLLPPSGISSNEQEGKYQKYDRKSRRGRQYESPSNTRRKEHKSGHSNDFNQVISNMSVSDSSANKTR